MLVEVRPEGVRPWLGTFGFGQVTPQGVSGIFDMPDPDRVCVVAQGEGYIIKATMPTVWETVRATPVIDVRPVLAREIIVFADYTTLVAYGPAGLKWETPRLTWHDLKITAVTDDFIHGEFWDVLNETTANFVVDLATGTHEGGIKDD